MLKERQRTILRSAVREYVRTARPISSQYLTQKYKFGFSPATVRNELYELDEAGFLEQPHTSAGRIPTDKGYRFYVNEILEKKDGILEKERQTLDELLRESRENFGYFSARIIARLSRNFAISGSLQNSVFYKAGFSEILAEPEFSDTNFRKEFWELADSIEEELMKFFDLTKFETPQVFIGEENPIKTARHCGMIISLVILPKGKELVAILGPKRMNYLKNISLINYLGNYGRRKKADK